MHPPPASTIAWLILLSVGALASALLALNLRQEQPETEKPELSLAYYLNEAELVGTGPSGTILYRVWTERAAQTRGADSVELAKVRMSYEPPDGLPWELQANAGRIPADASIIELTGDVVATTGTETENMTTLRTERLDIDPETRQAESDEPVSIENNGRVLHATGLRADFESNQLKLLADVNGRFAP